LDLQQALGRALQLLRQGQFAQAEQLYANVLAHAPDSFDALYFLGIIRFQQQHYAQALDLMEAALRIRPDAQAFTHHGSVLQKLGRPAEALTSYDKALALRSDLPDALYNRAMALSELKRFQDALKSYDEFLALRPQDADALCHRALTLLDLERHADALAALDEALLLHPRDPAMLTARGSALRGLRRLEDALAGHDAALAADPDHMTAHFNRANVLADLERFAEAVAGYDRVVAALPDNARAWNNRGTALYRMRRGDEALASYGKALALQPDYAEVLHKRGELLWHEKRDSGAAITDMEAALLADPDAAFLRGDLLYLKMRQADWRDYDAQKTAIDLGVSAGKRVALPLYYANISDSPAALQACARIYCDSLFPAAPAVQTGTRRAHAKIRVAYLSADYREHPIAYLAVGLFEKHDRAKFEITAIDNGWDDGSSTRKRINAAFDRILDISKLTDSAAAQAIRVGEFDILVDLHGHTQYSRIGVLARRPAPIQVSYLGFPGTLGAPYMDYILADRITIPQSEHRFFTEQVVTLPDTYQANDSRRPVIGDVPTRAACGLPEKAFVFCNFNFVHKLTPAMFALWMRVLKKVPGSVLWQLESNSICAENLRAEAAAHGIAGERLIFAPLAPQAAHLARLAQADLCLDTLPYNAHTTASDALWVGTPLVTCRGNSFAGRVAASLLTAMGLPELVADNPDAYETLIVKLASDPVLLGAIRNKLREQRLTAPLFDTDRFRRHIEAAYTVMWERLMRGEAPQAFAVAGPSPAMEESS
jgi:protein O-GlcNAc transferase